MSWNYSISQESIKTDNILERLEKVSSIKFDTLSIIENDSVREISLVLTGLRGDEHYINLTVDLNSNSIMLPIDNLVYLHELEVLLQKKVYRSMDDYDLFLSKISDSRKIRMKQGNKRYGTYKDKLLNIKKGEFSLSVILFSSSFNSCLKKYSNKNLISIESSEKLVENLINDNNLQLGLLFSGARKLNDSYKFIEQNRIVLFSLKDFIIVNDSVLSLYYRER